MDGCRVLIIEDEYFIAADLADALTGLGAVVLGPYGTLGSAQAFVSDMAQEAPGGTVDAVLLDINLAGTECWPLADALVAQQVPVILMTGYDRTYGPARFQNVARCQKPMTIGELVQAIGQAVQHAKVPAG